MFKKILCSVFMLGFLASCGSSDGVVSSGLKLAQGVDFSISVPSSWEELKEKEKLLPKPREGFIELAVTSTDLVGGFSNNLLILSDGLNTFTTSKDFSIVNNVGASDDYLDYTELESKSFMFNDEEESLLYIFEAKYNLETPKLKFLQTAHICDSHKVFLLTLALSTSIKDTSKYEEFMKTFNCK